MSDTSGNEPKPKRRGPRAKLDAKKRAEICAILSTGCPRRSAAAYVGCDAATINNTALRDPDFASALRKAEVQQEIALLARIQAAAKRSDGWRAAAWLLQKTYPERYARRPDTMTPEQVAAVLAQFAEILTRGIRNAVDRRKVGADLKLLTLAIANEAVGEKS